MFLKRTEMSKSSTYIEQNDGHTHVDSMPEVE